MARGVPTLLAGALLCLAAAPAASQGARTNIGQPAAEPPRLAASAQAATRALNLCSGLWLGGLTEAQIETWLNRRDPTYGDMPAMPTAIDRTARTVAVSYADDMPPRIVVWRPVIGCVQLPVGATMAAAAKLPRVPADVHAPDYDSRPWPMGDRDPGKPLPALAPLLEKAFDGKSYGGDTWAALVVLDGRIVGERYADGFGVHTASQTHSAAKSLTATMAGIALKNGWVELEKPGLLAGWRTPGDPRGSITLQHLLRMSSGLYGEGVTPNFKTIYTQGARIQDLAIPNFLDAMPGTRFRYNPADTMLVMRAIREGMADDARFLLFPYRELYWKIGMTRTVTHGDWGGDLFGSGQTWSTARDFARFGLLYLNDGVWQGERILPEGWARYVRTKGPAQPPKPPFYGAQFWIPGGLAGLPEDAFNASGGQGHYVMIVPSKGLVVVRRGFDTQSRFDIHRFTADVLKAVGR